MFPVRSLLFCLFSFGLGFALTAVSLDRDAPREAAEIALLDTGR